MRRNQRKITMTLLLATVLCLMFALPVSAKTKGYVKAYRALLQKGTVSADYVYKYRDSNGKLTSYKNNIGDRKIIGFRLLNVDGKGAPELILRVTTGSSSSGYSQMMVATYKGGKVKFLTHDTSNSILFSLGKNSYTYSRNGKSSNKYANAVYYSKAYKALYYEYKSTNNDNYDLKGKNYANKNVSKILYKIKGSSLSEYKSCSKETSGRGFLYYRTGDWKNSTMNYHSAKAYKAFEKKYFKGLKKYAFYKLTANNIKKKIK